MIVDAIEKEFRKAKRRSWDKIYVFVDLHEIIIKPDYQGEEPIVDYYDYAKELLQHLSSRKDICLVLWSCSHPHQIKGYIEVMSKDDISFDYINQNPEVKTNQMYGCYDDKPYYNIMIDDKCGVTPEELPLVLQKFKEHSLDESD